ncbi:hypothetical protein MKY59_25870 [Paenibacillus sp. FSL W8-0426]|uniref:hypothetical protein n=1 Tax=Paenibacillus sp. FSL W8-0426 TaxID=2921714 RepID=UPI0030DD88CA
MTQQTDTINKERIKFKLNDILKNVGFVEKAKRSELIEKGRKIELRLAKSSDDNELELIELKYEVLSLESELDISSFWRKTGIFVGYAIIILLYPIAYILLSGDINLENIATYLTYVISSAVGAIIYFISSRTMEGLDAPIYKMLVALALPFLFVSFLFTNDQGQIFDIKDRMLWAFILGYSCDLFISLMNKIIAKVKVAIG